MHLENIIATISSPALWLNSKKAREAENCQLNGVGKYVITDLKIGQNDTKKVLRDKEGVRNDPPKVQIGTKHVTRNAKTLQAWSENANRDPEKAEGFIDNPSIHEMPEPGSAQTDAPTKSSLCCSVRLMTAFIAMLALFLNYCIVFSLTFAMLCMTKQTGRYAVQLSAHVRPEFNWDRTTQGLILSAFYVGFAITLIIGGFVADLYKAKLVIVLGNLFQGVLSLLIPVLTRLLGAPALGVLRILQGLASGVVVPCVYVLLSKWAASSERTRLLGIAYLGIPLSEIVIFPMSGALCGLAFDGGWPLIFYVIGALTILFTLMLQFLVYEWPSQHPFVKQKEKEFLEFYSVKQTKKKRPPYKEMAKSSAVWSYCLCYCSQQWGFQVMSVFTPEFMQDVMKFNLHENGLLSAVPYIGMLFMRMAQTSLFNAVREKTHLSLTTLRKVNHAIGTLIPAAALLCMFFVKNSPSACVVLLTINMTIQDLAFTGGFGFCNVDFAPAFAGILSGIGMSTSIVLCIAMPNIVAAITPTGTHSEWMIVFIITAGSYVLAFIVYNRCGTSELQPWGMGRPETSGSQPEDKPPEKSK